MIRSRNVPLLLLILISLLVHGEGRTLASTTWIGTDFQVANWFDPANWSNGLPTGQQALFNDQAGASISGGNASATTISMTGGYFDPNIRISNGGTLTAQTVSLASGGAAHYGHVTVEGTGSRLTATEVINVGFVGLGAMTIRSGGRVEAVDFTVGGTSTSNGLLTLDGANTTLAVSNHLDIGFSGNATVTVKNGATLSAPFSGGIWLAFDSGSVAELIIGAGEEAGNLDAPVIYGANGTAIVNLSHTSAAHILSSNLTGSVSLQKNGSGKTTYTGAASHTGGTTLNSGIFQIGNGGTTGSINGNITNNASLIVNRSNRWEYIGQISGNGSFRQTGTGTAVFSGNQSYSGATTVENGRLLVHGALFSPVTVHAGATLGGAAQLGNVTVQDEGILSPGEGNTATMTFSSLTLEGDTTVRLELGLSSDTLTAASVNLGSAGRIEFELDDSGAGPMQGAIYRLLSFTSASGLQLSDLSYNYIGTAPDFTGFFTLGSGGIDFTVQTIPEASTCGLIALGLAVLAGSRRRRGGVEVA